MNSQEKKIIDLFCEYRIRCNISIRKAALILDCSHSLLEHIENQKRNPKPWLLKRMIFFLQRNKEN